MHHDDVIKWKHFPRYWSFVRGIHRSPVNSPHKSQWREALMFLWSAPWINGWVNNRGAGDLSLWRHCSVTTESQREGRGYHTTMICVLNKGIDNDLPMIWHGEVCYCPACRTTLVATRFRVAVICPIIQVPHCIRVFFYFVWFVFLNHIFQFCYELCTYCNILDIYLS